MLYYLVYKNLVHIFQNLRFLKIFHLSLSLQDSQTSSPHSIGDVWAMFVHASIELPRNRQPSANPHSVPPYSRTKRVCILKETYETICTFFFEVQDTQKGSEHSKNATMPQQLTEPLKWQDMLIFSPRSTRDSFQSCNCTNLFSVLMTIHWTKIPVKVANFTDHDFIKSTKENSVATKDIVVRSMYHACLSRVVWRVDRIKLGNKGQT